MRLHSLEKVARLRAAGHRAEAEVACRALVASNPGNPDALWLLGALCHESDRVSEARAWNGG
jgi:Flp pilus assembly protein TadD